MNKHFQNINRYNFLTEELLREEYSHNGLSDRQIANKYEMPSKTVVWKKRKKFGIENKYSNKSNKNARKNRKFNISFEEANLLKKSGKSFSEIAEHIGCSVVVAKRRFKELGLCENQEQDESYSHYDVELSDSQKQLVIGSLLGDGAITESGAYACSHSVKQEEYFKFKMNNLENLHSWRFQKQVHNYEYLKSETESLHFTTGCNRFLYEMRTVYYPSGKKEFPHEFLRENLKPEGLAYWYLDDGFINGGNFCFCAHAYSDVKLISAQLEEMFGIKSSVQKSKGKDSIVYVLRGSLDLFYRLLIPYVEHIPSMMYKLKR